MSQDFHRANLQGHDFRRQDLVDADFSYADIRGANFSQANLKGANFSHARAGLSHLWFTLLSIGLGLTVWTVGVVLGFVATFAYVASVRYNTPTELLFSALIPVGLLSIFVGVMLRRGLNTALALTTVIAVATIVLSIAFVETGTYAEEMVAVTVLQAFAVAGSVAGVVIGAITGALTTLLLPSLLQLGSFALMLLGIGCGLWIGLQFLNLENNATPAIWVGHISTVTLVLVFLGLTAYIVKQANSGKAQYTLVRKLAITLHAQGGTSFYKANLTEADFYQASLRSTDLRYATLTRTHWHQAKYLRQARTDSTYLEDREIQQLVILKEGREQDFSYRNLRGINLEDGNLQDINFSGADLSETNLKQANLSQSNLTKAQLYQADLTQAILTGACIQDWAIATDTKLERVICDYIYMRMPTREDRDPWRKPDNRDEVFQEGDFTDFIAPIIKTLDLYRQQNVDPRQIAKTFKSLDIYHYGGIDPAAAAIAFQQLAEEHPEAGLEITALEGRGEEKIRLQAAVTSETDSSRLNAKYFEKYRQIVSLSYPDIQALLTGVAEKDKRIHSLEKLLEDALKQPKFYVETYQNQGEFVMSQSKGNVNISGVQGNVSGIAAAGENQTMTGVAMGTISGSVTNTINQLPPSPDPDKLGLKELLAQLQAAIEAESELPDEDKAEALEQVRTLAEAGQKPEDNLLQKAAKTSMKILKGTIASLPDAAKLAESCAKLLPAIATLLALV